MACVIDSGGKNRIAVIGFPYTKKCYFMGLVKLYLLLYFQCLPAIHCPTLHLITSSLFSVSPGYSLSDFAFDYFFFILSVSRLFIV